MILQLLKKDCIIAKNYVAAVILIGVGLPGDRRKFCVNDGI